jgi:prevent-host-death family protein
MTVTEAKAHLNEIVDEAASTHEQIVITKHGVATAVIIASDDLESLKESLFWLSQPNILEDLARAEAEIAEGKGISTEQLVRELGLPYKPK